MPRSLSLSDWFGYALPRTKKYELIKQAGFDGVLLFRQSDKTDPGSHTVSCAHAAREAGLVIDNLHAPFTDVNSLWSEQPGVNAFEQEISNSIRECASVCIPVMIMHLSSGNNPPPPNKAGFERIRRLVEQAEKEGVLIALENLRKPEYLRAVFSQIESSSLCFCFDSGHQNCFAPHADVLGEYGKRIAAVHLHDNAGIKELVSKDDEHRLPLDGAIHWEHTMRKLKESSYSGSITLEVENKGYETLSAQSFLAQAANRAQKLRDLFDSVLPISVRRATAADIPCIEDILLDAVAWLETTDFPCWKRSDVSWQGLSRLFSPEDFYIAFYDGVPAGCMAIIDYDPAFWPDIPRGKSLFLHKLAVKRFAAKHGVSHMLIDYAKQLCRERSLPFLRLDTHIRRLRVRELYEKMGFVFVEQKFLFGNYDALLYECAI